MSTKPKSVKVWFSIHPDVYAAILAASAKRGLKEQDVMRLAISTAFPPQTQDISQSTQKQSSRQLEAA